MLINYSCRKKAENLIRALLRGSGCGGASILGACRPSSEGTILARRVRVTVSGI